METIASFHEKELLLSYYPEQDSHIIDRDETVLDLSNYANKKN